MRSEREVSRVIERYADTVRRICLLHLKNYADTEDIFQTVFLKYALYSGEFESAEHEKAWLIRVTVNACHDLLKSFSRKNTVSLELLSEEAAAEKPENGEVLAAVLSLPQKYKDVIYLHYYEGYSAVEIAKMLGKNENTVYSLLSRARNMLKDILGGEEL
ncbi:MAG: sigma-70 family RNA polymerase sigma factor [Clostridia bacterium]|nr:sigma-70 family RNA polymerase sigma factor [Clostridia bacterium]